MAYMWSRFGIENRNTDHCKSAMNGSLSEPFGSNWSVVCCRGDHHNRKLLTFSSSSLDPVNQFHWTLQKALFDEGQLSDIV